MSGTHLLSAFVPSSVVLPDLRNLQHVYQSEWAEEDIAGNGPDSCVCEGKRIFVCDSRREWWHNCRVLCLVRICQGETIGQGTYQGSNGVRQITLCGGEPSCAICNLLRGGVVRLCRASWPVVDLPLLPAASAKFWMMATYGFHITR